VFVALIVGVVVFVAALGALLVDQVGALVDAIPGYARQITEFLNDTLGTELSGDKLAANLLGNPGVQDFVNGLAAAAVGLSTTLVGLILQGLTIGLFTFYLVADGPRLRRSVCSVLPPGRQQVENMVLSPRITSRTMALHPAVAFGAVIAGGAIMGPIGALLALPAAASVQALVSSYLHRYEVVASPLVGPSADQGASG
jgi:predicted PurR-regulated permease PerM